MRFGTIARQQQARFRDTLPVAARSPTDDKGLRHGHLLALGHEIENLMPELRGQGGALDLFSSRGIKWWRNGRSSDGPGDGPTRNLASSQVACVNFLLPLARRPDAMLAFLRAVDPDVVEVEPIPDPGGQPPSLVEFEWVGWKEPLEGGRITRGAMQTSADAIALGRTQNGRRAYVFEWKYCEEYLRPADMGEGSAGATRRRRYKDRYEAEDSAFRGATPLDEFLFEPFYQLLRLRLLADEIERTGLSPDHPVAEARVVVVCPEANSDYRLAVQTTPLAKRYPRLTAVEVIMRAELRDPRGIAFAASEDLVARFSSSSQAPMLADWLDYHLGRYGW